MFVYRTGQAVAALVAGVALLAMTGCSPARGPVENRRPPAVEAPDRVDDFLKQNGLEVAGAPEKFQAQVPVSWEVPLGAYPVGVYWGLANEFSRDAGLDLTRLKGKTVEVRRYSLAGGLPGEGEQRRFPYPSDAVLLVQDQAVVGAWLAFNKWGIGPSVKQRNLQEITGLTLEQWVERERYFTDPGPNSDLSRLGPAEVLAAFLEAINKGDKTRANACLAPRTLVDALTVNLMPARLYNPDFGGDNSLVENIVKAKLISFRMVEPGRPDEELKDAGGRSRVELAAEMELTWKNAAFNTPGGRTTRFAGMVKGANGWKLTGLGTGP